VVFKHLCWEYFVDFWNRNKSLQWFPWPAELQDVASLFLASAATPICTKKTSFKCWCRWCKLSCLENYFILQSIVILMKETSRISCQWLAFQRATKMYTSEYLNYWWVFTLKYTQFNKFCKVNLSK